MILPRRSSQVGPTSGFADQRVAVPGNVAAGQVQQLGAAIERATGAGFEVVSEQQRELSNSRIKEADNRAADTFREVMGRYRQTLGKAATGEGRTKVFGELRERLQDLSDGLDTEDEKTAFRDQVDARMVQAQSFADAHEADQVRADAVGQADARKKSEMLDAVAAVGNPQQFAEHRGVMLEEVETLADLDQLAQDDPRRKLARIAALTDLHEQAIRALVDRPGGAAAARAHLQAFSEEIAPTVRGKLQSLIDRANVGDESTRLQFAIMDKIRADFSASKREGAVPTAEDKANAWRLAYEKADELFRNGSITAEVRDATLGRLEGEERRLRVEDAQIAQQTLADAERWLIDNPLQPVSAMPPGLYDDAASMNLLDDLQGFSQARRYTTDPAAFAMMLALPDDVLRRISPAELFVRFRGKLDNGDLGMMFARQAHAVGKATEEQTKILSADEQVQEAAKRLKLIPRVGPRSATQDETLYRWSKEAQKRMNDFEHDQLGGKRKASEKEIDAILDQMSIDTAFLPSWGRDPQVPVAAMSDAEQEAAYLPVGSEEIRIRSVPKGQQKKIIAALERKGRPVTEAAIVDLWVRGGKQGDQ